jgi:hypothetical protein
MNIRLLMITFIIGLGLGIAGTIYLPRTVFPYLPESIVGKETIIKGLVMAKQRQGNTLLLTLNTSQGALLATITKSVEGVDLLVNGNDEIEIALKTYTPFINDPKITRVLKNQQNLPVEQGKARAASGRTQAEPSSKEAKPKHSRTSTGVATAPTTTTEVKQQVEGNEPPVVNNKGIGK